MSHPTARLPVRLLTAGFALALAVLGLLLPARPVSATSPVHGCSGEPNVAYFSSAAHTQEVGLYSCNCSTRICTLAGTTSPYSVEVCQNCPD